LWTFEASVNGMKETIGHEMVNRNPQEGEQGSTQMVNHTHTKTTGETGTDEWT